jgi:hypothetical protein
MIKNESNLTAAQSSAAEILKGGHVSVAEAVQIILQYISDNRGRTNFAAGVSYMEEVLELVCQECEPDQVVL